MGRVAIDEAGRGCGAGHHRGRLACGEGLIGLNVRDRSGVPMPARRQSLRYALSCCGRSFRLRCSRYVWETRLGFHGFEKVFRKRIVIDVARQGALGNILERENTSFFWIAALQSGCAEHW